MEENRKISIVCRSPRTPRSWTTVNLNKSFYAWVFQFVGRMKITAPEYVRECYARYLEQALDETLGE